MAPGKNDRPPGHTGTIPKTKVRNNCNVPQEAVTPTRRDVTSNLGTASLDWVPVSEYNTRLTNCNQSRNPGNNSSDNDLTDLDHSIPFDSGFGRFVPVRPQPRVLPLNQQNHDNISIDSHDNGTGASMSDHHSHPNIQSIPNGLTQHPHSNHAPAAVMIVNPTTPNACSSSIHQPYHNSNHNRNNLIRNYNASRNQFEGSSNLSNNNISPAVNRPGAKTVNLINNMYDQMQASFSNFNENDHVHREQARVLGEAIVAACPDAAAVERRLGQIREYIRVTSSLVDTMRNSEDEAFVEHTKEEYDELVEMIMKLKESENKLDFFLNEKQPDKLDIPPLENNEHVILHSKNISEILIGICEENIDKDKHKQCMNNSVQNNIDSNAKQENIITNDIVKEEVLDGTELVYCEGQTVDIHESDSHLTISNEKQANVMINDSVKEDVLDDTELVNDAGQAVVIHESGCKLTSSDEKKTNVIRNDIVKEDILDCAELVNDEGQIMDFHETDSHLTSSDEKQSNVIINDIVKEEVLDGTKPIYNIGQTIEIHESDSRLNNAKVDSKNIKKEDEYLNAKLRKNILSCVEKVALIEEMKLRNDTKVQAQTQQDVVVRPVSSQSNGSAYSENELWQNEIKNKMESSQIRLAALKHQQKKLIKYQEEAKQQLEAINRERQSQESQPSTSHDNSHQFSEIYNHTNRTYPTNQVGVATTLPQSSESAHAQHTMINNVDEHSYIMSNSMHSQDDRFSHADGIIVTNSEEAAGGAVSEEENERVLSEQGRLLQMKLRELQHKKQHMENLVSEFQKLQMATRIAACRNTYSSSGEESGDEEPARKCNKSSANNKNDDPFKTMEIKAIKTALQKTKDLMRSVEKYEVDQITGIHEDPYQMPRHSNLHDNKSEGGSVGGWSNDGSVCRVRNSIQQRPKFTNEQHSQQQHQQQSSHEANLASLQELAQELRLETEKIMGERARIKHIVSNKDVSRKQKKVNEEIRSAPSGGASSCEGVSVTASSAPPGPVERRQMQLRSLLAEKQRELEALLNKEKMICLQSSEIKSKIVDPHTAAANHSYHSEQEGGNSHSDLLVETQNVMENVNFQVCDDSGLGELPSSSHLENRYPADSASRTKFNQRSRTRRRQTQERSTDENIIPQPSHSMVSRTELENSTIASPTPQTDTNPNVSYPQAPPTFWNGTKSKQDVRTNQFTQNSHSQTMDRLLGTPQLAYPPSVPFNMMMPYGMVGGCGCGCSFWGAWCWQQIMMQQREIHQLRDQLNHLEERWRVENPSHTLNNQVPPGNRANNYWDNFRSYSRQNLLSTNSKTNADGHLGVGSTHNPHPLVDRSHNTLHHTPATPPSTAPKRNLNMASASGVASQSLQNADGQVHNSRRNVYERSLSFSSAPDVLNIQKSETDVKTGTHSRNLEDSSNTSNLNLNTEENISNSLRNLNISNTIPEIIQSHSNNLNTSCNNKNKSSSKLPAKNVTQRQNSAASYVPTSNLNVASTSGTQNSNLASSGRDIYEKATSKLFDLLRENVYSEVTTLIGVNESHPDFLIQLFRELQLISSDHLRQKVLQSIRNVLAQYSSGAEDHGNAEETRQEMHSTNYVEASNYQECNSVSSPHACTSTMQIDNNLVHFLLQRCDEICTAELLNTLTSHILSNIPNDAGQTQVLKKKVKEVLSKYEGAKVCDVSSDILESLAVVIANNDNDESTQQLASELSESPILQDVAGSLNMLTSSEIQLHQVNNCPYDTWSTLTHIDLESREHNENASSHSNRDEKVDLINCMEMNNGDLAEADQSCYVDSSTEHNSHVESASDALPDVVDTEETTPTEAEAEWIGLDRVPTRLHMEESSEKQKGDINK